MHPQFEDLPIVKRKEDVVESVFLPYTDAFNSTAAFKNAVTADWITSWRRSSSFRYFKFSSGDTSPDEPRL
jgi:hypothetical protein